MFAFIGRRIIPDRDTDDDFVVPLSRKSERDTRGSGKALNKIKDLFDAKILDLGINHDTKQDPM